MKTGFDLRVSDNKTLCYPKYGIEVCTELSDRPGNADRLGQKICVAFMERCTELGGKDQHELGATVYLLAGVVQFTNVECSAPHCPFDNPNNLLPEEN